MKNGGTTDPGAARIAARIAAGSGRYGGNASSVSGQRVFTLHGLAVL